MAERLAPHQRALLFAGAVSVVALVVPIISWLLLPVSYLNTHIHEFCHAVIGVATGGQVLGIEVFATGGGVTPISGGVLALVAAAGYCGSTMVGCALILLTRTERGAVIGLRLLAILLGVSVAVWVRSDFVGVAAGVGWTVLLWAGSYLRGPNLLFAAQFIGLQQVLASLQSVLVLLHASQMGIGHSDAVLMSQAVFLPPLFWACSWTALAFAATFYSIKMAWKRPIT